MRKYRDLEEIAFDLAKVLGIYKDSYAGSPYKDSAELILNEYQQFLAHWQGLRCQTIDSWSDLEGKITTLLYDDDKPLSELLEKSKEIVETVRCFKNKDNDVTLDSVIGLLQSLKSSAEVRNM